MLERYNDNHNHGIWEFENRNITKEEIERR